MSPAQRHRVEANGTASRKRPRQRSGDDDPASDGEVSHRRRAPIACRACRARKVKCSNERPTCAACARLRCECVYPEPLRYALESSERDDTQVTNVLHQILRRLPSVPASRADHQIASHPAREEVDGYFAPLSSRWPPSPTASDSVVGESPAFTSLDHVFQWRMFYYSGAERFKGVVLAADHIQTLHPEAALPAAAATGTGVPFLDGDEITMLLRKFLRLVHVMNPVMDCNTLLAYGREVAELGPRWDAKTCLVLVAAALGVIAKPFSAILDTAESLSTSASRDDDVHIRQKADSYYEYARRRFGLLDRSLTACHCHFWSGIYLLYTSRPVQAWQSFFQASSLYIVYLKSRVAAEGTDNGYGPHEELRCRLEQRLYWSCVKSESEICTEIELPRSGLHNINCTYLFPSPPTPKSVDGLNDSGPDVAATSSSKATATPASAESSELQDFKELHEHSWFNYLSEISLLRLSSRVNQHFYTQPPASWTSTNLLDMMNAAWDFEKQLERWQEALPPAISCFGATLDFAAVTELQLASWSRCANIKLRLYRPFLYRYASRQDQDWMLRDALRQFAEKAVLLSLDPLFTLSLRHRHAGAWYKCREAAARALMVLCAKATGLTERMGVAARVEWMLDVCLWHLRYWEGEAEDVRLARRIIERIREGMSS